MSKDSQQSRRQQFIWGILIICLGVSFLISQNDWVALGQIWRYWPAILAAFGINNLIPPTSGRRFVEGLSMIATAGWFYAASERMWGLTFGNSWPIVVIIGGAGMVLTPLMVKYFDKNKEN